MSLLDAMNEKIVMMDKRSNIPDGRGGYTTGYVEGAEFDAVVEITNSLDETVAEQQGVTGVYDVTISRGIRLQFHDVFKRVSDGKIFRVTSKDDSETPSTTNLDIRKVRAEEWELPTND